MTVFWKWWNSLWARKKESSASPMDTRLEIVSEGLISASGELQTFVVLLQQKYGYPKGEADDSAGNA